MKNYFSYPEGMENLIEWKVNKKNIICFVTICSKNGGVLPDGIQLVHNRTTINERSEAPEWDAMEQVNGILNLKEDAIDFITHWKRYKPINKEDIDYIIDDKGYTKGMCFELPSEDNENEKPIVKLPPLYALANKADETGNDKDDIDCVGFYGNKPKLEQCEQLAMHICRRGTYADKSEFVFLTPIPDSWYI